MRKDDFDFDKFLQNSCLTVAIDFDGVLGEYHGWQGWSNLGKPDPAIVTLINQMMCAGWTVIIWTTRGSLQMKEWLARHGITVSYINMNPVIMGENPSKVVCDVLIDDRCICYNGDADKLKRDLMAFKPWWEEKDESEDMLDAEIQDIIDAHAWMSPSIEGHSSIECENFENLQYAIRSLINKYRRKEDNESEDL